MKTTMLAIAVSLLFCASAQAADAPASSMPPYGKAKPMPAEKIVKKTLPNGLQVWVVPRKGVPRVDYVLAVSGAGYAADDKAHPGFASTLAFMLNEGTAKRDSRAIAEAAQGMGGTVGGSTSNDGMTVSANALASQAGPMMQLLAEVTRSPNFPAKEVELAKNNALEALKVSEANPAFRAERAITKAVYGDHPYGATTGTVAAVNSITPDLLRAEHTRRFRPERTLLIVAGRIDEAEAIKLATAAFGDWKGVGDAPKPVPGAALNVKPARLLLQRASSVQSTLRLGSPGITATTDDYVPLRLTSTILGGGMSSRVMQNLRENKGYTYGASAGARSARNGGIIIAGADVRNDVTGAALKEYFHEFTRIGNEPVSEEELTMNKRYVAGNFLLENQLQRAVAGTLATYWLIGLPPEFLAQYVPAIQKVTAEQVSEVGKKYFNPAIQSIVVVGDPAAVSEQLKAYGEFTVITDK